MFIFHTKKMSNNNNSNNKKYFKKTNYGGGHDLSSCRGASIILGTCDAAKEREASRELVNLFSGLIDEKFPNSESSVENTNASSSIAELLKLEAENVRERKHHSQSVVSINTNIKGIILIKIIRDDLCPVDLTKILFDRVKRDKLPCCRYSIRLIPLQRAFFPDETEFASNAKTVFSNYLPNAAESEPSTSEDKTLDVDEPASKRFRLSENKIRFQILFKARNHNVLNRETVFRIINGAMHPFGKGDYLHPEVRTNFVLW